MFNLLFAHLSQTALRLPQTAGVQGGSGRA